MFHHIWNPIFFFIYYYTLGFFNVQPSFNFSYSLLKSSVQFQVQFGWTELPYFHLTQPPGHPLGHPPGKVKVYSDSRYISTQSAQKVFTGRKPQSKTTSKEDDLTGRRHHRKTTSHWDNLTGRRLHRKTTSQEDDLTGRWTLMKMTLKEDEITGRQINRKTALLSLEYNNRQCVCSL